MRIRALYSILLISSICVSPAKSQEHCNRLLDHGIYNTAIAAHESELDTFSYFALCDSEGKAKEFRHDGKVGMVQMAMKIAGDWAYSEESRRVGCEQRFDEYRGREREATVVKSLSGHALNAWNQCQELNKKEIVIKPDVGDSYLKFTIRNDNPHADYRIDSVDVKGLKACKVRGRVAEEVKSMNLPTSDSVVDWRLLIGLDYTVFCEREEHKAPEGGEPADSRGAYLPAEILIATSRGSFLMTLEGYKPINELKAKIGKLEADLIASKESEPKRGEVNFSADTIASEKHPKQRVTFESPFQGKKPVVMSTAPEYPYFVRTYNSSCEGFDIEVIRGDAPGKGKDNFPIQLWWAAIPGKESCGG